MFPVYTLKNPWIKSLKIGTSEKAKRRAPWTRRFLVQLLTTIPWASAHRVELLQFDLGAGLFEGSLGLVCIVF
jgi:hypothetical protein